MERQMPTVTTEPLGPDPAAVEQLDLAETIAIELEPGKARDMILSAIRAAAALSSDLGDPSRLRDAVMSAARITVVQSTEMPSAALVLPPLWQVQRSLLGGEAATRLARLAAPRAAAWTSVTTDRPAPVHVARPAFEPHRVDDVLASLADDEVPEPPAREGSPETTLPLDAESAEAPRNPEDQLWTPEVIPRARQAEGYRVRPLRAFRARVVDEALVTMAGLARARREGPLAARRDHEARMVVLSDVVLASGGDPVAASLRSLLDGAELFGPSLVFAAAFCLCRFGEPDALAALKTGLERLGEDDDAGRLELACAAAEAIAVVAPPGLEALTNDLRHSQSCVARATSVRLAGMRGEVGESDVRAWAFEPSRMMIRAALRCVREMEPSAAAPLLPLLSRLLGFPDRLIAFEASLSILAQGHFEPFDRLVGIQGKDAAEALIDRLGPFALEVFALRGGPEHADVFQRIARRQPADERVLDCTARFGNPGAWPILLRELAGDFSDAAETALVTLYGHCLEDEQRAEAAAWKRAIAPLGLSDETRYRRGVPFSKSILCDEIRSGELSRAEAEARVIELRAHRFMHVPVALWQWGASLDEELRKLG